MIKKKEEGLSSFPFLWFVRDLLNQYDINSYIFNGSSFQRVLSFRYQKKQTKCPIEPLTLKQEMEPDDDHATMREVFSLAAQNLVFYKYTHDIIPDQTYEILVEKLWVWVQVQLVID